MALYNSFRNTGGDLRVVSTNTATEPITLAEAKAYIRITNTEEDTLITSMITNARMQCEKYLNSDILPKTRTLFLNYTDAPINLPYAPIATVDSVTVDGAVQALDEGYEILGLDNPLISLDQVTAEKVSITYTTAGISDISLYQGILAYIAWLYHGRDATMPTNWKAWLSPFKTYGYYGTR